MVRIIIAGSRNFTDYSTLERKMIRIIYRVGKDYPDQNLIFPMDHEVDGRKVFGVHRGNMEIISGMAEGADSLGVQFAKNFYLKLVEFPAKWNDFSAENCYIKMNQYGNQYNALAGLNRNEEMANFATADDSLGVLALFWDGKSHGSKHMKRIANKKGMLIYETKDS